MKKILFLFILMGSVALANAQSVIAVTYQNGIYNDGDTITVMIGAEDHNCNAVGFKNQSNSYQEALVINLEELVPGCVELYGLCLGNDCLARLTSGPFDIPIRGTYNDFVMDFNNIYAEEGVATPSFYSLSIGNDNCNTTVVLKFRISGVGIDEVDSHESNLSIYPNPASSMLNIALGNNETTTSVSIFNMAGQKVIDTIVPAGTTNSTINVADLPKGVYNVVLNDGSSKKLIVK